MGPVMQSTLFDVTIFSVKITSGTLFGKLA